MIAVSGSGIAGLAAALAILRNQKPLLLVAGSTPATTLHGGVQIAPNGWHPAAQPPRFDQRDKNLCTEESMQWLHDLPWAEVGVFTGGCTITVPQSGTESFERAGMLCLWLWEEGFHDLSKVSP